MPLQGGSYPQVATGRQRAVWLVAVAVLCLLQLVPVWALAYFPSQDGPSHLANVYALARWADGAALYRSFYQVSIAPVPNWAATALLYPLLRLLTPLGAHRVFLTVNALAMAAGWAWWVGVTRTGAPDRGPVSWRVGLSEAGPLALLGPLFVANFFLMKGLYSFCLSLPLFLFAVGYAWRNRVGLRLPQALVLNVLLALVWFGHLVSFAMAFGCCAVILALGAIGRESPGKRRAPALLAPAAALLPVTALPLWLLRTNPFVTSTVGGWNAGKSFAYLFHTGWLTWFATGQVLVSTAVTALLLGLLSWGLLEAARHTARDRERLAFLALAGGALAVYLVAPRGAAGGWYLNERLAVFPLFLVVPLVRLPRGARARAALAGGIVLAALVQFRFTMDWCTDSAADVAEFASLAPRVEPGHTVMALVFRPGEARPSISPLAHAASYYALASEGVDLGNYEAGTEHFQLRWRSGRAPDAAEMERTPASIDPESYDPKPDYLVLWAPDAAGAQTLGRLAEHYRGVARSGRVVLLRRKEPAPIPRTAPSRASTPPGV